MNTKNSPSAFRDLRQRAGYIQREIAEILGVSVLTVGQWENGRRPGAWRYVRGLARLFDITEAEAVKLFWNELPGSPSRDGLGVKILPDRDEAEHLYVAIPCQGCGKVRIHHEGDEHYRFCPECAKSRQGFGCVTLRCVGYSLYEEPPQFSKNCAGEATRIRSRLKNLRNKKDNGTRAFVDETRGIYRCGRCSQSALGYRRLEKNVRDFLRAGSPAFNFSQAGRDKFFSLTRFYPHQVVPKIRSFARLSELRQACKQLPYADANGNMVRFLDYLYRKPVTAPRERGVRSDEARKTQLASVLVTCARNGRVSFVRGYCQFCAKIIFSNRAAIRAHKLCSVRNAVKSGGVTRRRGRPVDLGNLRKHYAWFIRHKIGRETLTAIAEDAGVTKLAVLKSVASVIDRLPDLELVGPTLRPRLSLFTHSQARFRYTVSVPSFWALGLPSDSQCRVKKSRRVVLVQAQARRPK